MAGNYVVDYSGQMGLYYIRTTEHRQPPQGLVGYWTHKHMAEEKMHAWVEEQKTNGANKRSKAT